MNRFANIAPSVNAANVASSNAALWLAAGKVMQAQQDFPALTPMPRGSRAPLSLAQARLWFHCYAEPKSPAYSIPFAWRIHGELDRSALEKAFSEIVARHEVLRTNFKLEDGQPCQFIAPNKTFRIADWNLGALSPEIREAALHATLANEARIPFQLEGGALFRVSLFHTTQREHVFLLLLHHIVFDGWSLGILLQELSALYTSFIGQPAAALPPVKIQYADYALWQEQWLRRPVQQELLSYWKKHLKDAPPALALRGDRPRPASLTEHGACHYFEVDPEVLVAIQALRKSAQASLYSVLLAGFYALLFRYTGQDDLVVGSPAANRSPLETRGMIGFFINMLALRARISGDQSFNSFLRSVSDLTASALAHQYYPFQHLVRELTAQRVPGRTPLFQVCFVFQTLPRQGLNLTGAPALPVPVDTRTAKYELTLDLREDSGGVRGFFEYSTDLFSGAYIQRMESAYQALLYHAATEPYRPIGALPLQVQEFARNPV